MMNKLLIFLLLFLSVSYSVQGSDTNYARTTDRIWLDSKEVHQGEYTWKMMKVGDVKASCRGSLVWDMYRRMVICHCPRELYLIPLYTMKSIQNLIMD